jgi:hypothetical protein
VKKRERDDAPRDEHDGAGATNGGRQQPQLTIRFCGGCNPVIDRKALADALRAGERPEEAARIVFISGCSRACASGRVLVSDSPDAVIVAGEHVEGERTAEAQITAAVQDKLKE